MMTNLEQEHFYVIDYFLNGHFLHSTATVNASSLAIADFLEVVLPQTGETVFAQVIEIEPVSDNEYRVLLAA